MGDMYTQASKINGRLKNVVDKLGFGKLDGDDDLLTELCNTIIRFGQIAKFRCRSNAAYKNFVDSCLKGVAEVSEEDMEHNGVKFKGLVAKVSLKKRGEMNGNS